MASVIGYVRVSTEEQAGSGLGLEAQEAAIRAAAVRLGLPVAAIYRDAGISGAASLERRPGLLDAIGALDRGAVLLVAKRDRLGRGDPVLVAMVERMASRRGGRIVSAAGEGTDGNDPTDVLMRRIVDAFAEYERLLIGARTKAALKAKRARGEKTGGAVPFGYTLQDGGRLEPDSAEQATVREMRELRDAGCSLSGIAAELNRQGHRTKQGTVWTHKQVSRALAGTTETIPTAAPATPEAA